MASREPPNLKLTKAPTVTYTGYQPVRPVDEDAPSPPKKEIPDIGQRADFDLVLSCLTLIISVLLLIAWLIWISRPQHLGMWKSAPIGGEFDQIIAKSIDFAVGAICAPLIMAILSFLWFRLARIAAYNEYHKDQRPVALSAILEMSITSAGSYDPWKMWTFIRTTRVRLILVGMLALLAALGTSFLANVIAYEAISVARTIPAHADPTLNLLKDLYFDLHSDDMSTAQPFNLTGKDLNDFGVEWTGMLHSVGFGTHKFDSGQRVEEDGSMIFVNATQASLRSVGDNVRKLQNIPAYRQTVSCEPANIESFIFFGQDNQSVRIEAYARPVSELDGLLFDTQLPGKLDQIDNNQEGFYNYILFSNSSTKILLGAANVIPYAHSTNNSLPTPDPSSQPSEFGDVPYSIFDFNKTVSGAQHGAHSVIEVWGITCDLHKQPGTVDLTVSGGPNREWAISSFQFNNDTQAVQSLLYSLQEAFNYRAPVSEPVLSGIGTALGYNAQYTRDLGDGTESISFNSSYRNFTTYARNFLFVSARTESMAMEIALSDLTRDNPDKTFRVSGSHTVLKYRITYIPGLLLAALIAIVLSAAIVLGMTLYTRKTMFNQKGRIVDGLRLMIDFASAVQHDEMLADAAGWSRKELEKYGKDVRARYAVIGEGGGRCVTLVKEEKGD